MAKLQGVHSGGRIGEIMDHGSSTIPAYALACNGAAVSRTTYSALFSVIGTTFGAGDGSTTFNLPNGLALFKRGAGTQSVGGISHSATHGTTSGDTMQGHYHGTYGTSNVVSNSSTGPLVSNIAGSTLLSPYAGAAITDGTNGTPRTGAETAPANLAITYAIIFQ